MKKVVRDRNKEIVDTNVEKQIQKGFGIGKRGILPPLGRFRLLVPSRKQKGDTKKVITANFQFKYEKAIVSKTSKRNTNLSSRLPLFSQSNQLKRNDFIFL